jgi:hypothetical protein
VRPEAFVAEVEDEGWKGQDLSDPRALNDVSQREWLGGETDGVHRPALLV